MRIFVSEFLTSGACRDDSIDSPLLSEGRAMADALIADCAAIPDVAVATTWDDRLPAPACDGIDVRRVSRREQERELFHSLLVECDTALLIAPECDGILERRLREADTIAGTDDLLNCSPKAAGLCGDKLRLAGWLAENDILTPQTEPFCIGSLRPNDRCIVKPRFGAGCEQTYLIDTNDLPSHASLESAEFIIQPFVTGIPLSSAVVLSSKESRATLLPLGRQQIHGEREFSYRGGSLPWRDRSAGEVNSRAAKIVEEICDRLPGLRGYVGFDWVWNPTDGRLWLIEINPRLTTSYVGYRQLFGTELIRVLLGLDPTRPLVAASEVAICFTPRGGVERRSSEASRGPQQKESA